MATTEAEGFPRSFHALTYIRLTGRIASITADATSASAGLRQILQLICQELDWNVGLFWAPGAQKPTVLRLAECWPAEEYPNFLGASGTRSFQPGEGLPGRVFGSGQPACVEDVRTDVNFPRGPFATADALGSGFAFPVFSGHELVGVMEFYSSSSRAPNPDMLEAMGALGSHLGLFVKRVQLL